MNVLTELRSRFRAALRPLATDVEPFVAMVRPTQNSQHGDYQANFAMPLAKQRGTNPKQLAQEIVSAVDVSDLCETPEVAGPGFINLRLKTTWIEAAATQAARDPRLGVPEVEKRSVVLDFSGPNVAKPMHVGHLRSTVIGDSIYRMLKFLGHEVIGDNHLGDWGTQFGMIIYGYKHFLDRPRYEAAPVAELSRLYRLVNTLCDSVAAQAELPKLEAAFTAAEQKRTEIEATSVPTEKKEADVRKKKLKDANEAVATAKENLASCRKKIDAVDNDPKLQAMSVAHPNILVDTRKETAKLHAGDAENRDLWNQFMPACLQAMQGVYDRLDIHFDKTLGESFYDPMLADVVADLERRGLATNSEGATCVFLEGFDAPFIVRKRDGAYTYATTDLATIRYRVEQLKANTMLYVVDARQSDHFEMLFATAKKWGYDNVAFEHVKFGTVLGPDNRPYKTRAGDTVGLESLLDEGVAFARGIVDENSADLDPEARQQIAEIVGLGAIKYADLRNNRESDYQFELSKMIATRGDTATYMQYAFARVCGIFEKCDTTRDAVRSSPARIVAEKSSERALLVKLLQFTEALQQATTEYRPHYLTTYLFETANVFSTFYNECSVRDAETPELRASRLQLCDYTAQVLQKGLGMLGVKTAERM